MFSTSSPTYPASVRVVASAIVNGTSNDTCASVCASKRLAAAGRPDQQDVRFGELDLGTLGAVIEPLVMVVDRDREHAFGAASGRSHNRRGARCRCPAGSARRHPCDSTTSVAFVSSRMISLHSSTHSSQMNTVGPAISLRTSCCDLPQNEQYRVLFESPPLSFVIDHLRSRRRRVDRAGATPAEQPGCSSP